MSVALINRVFEDEVLRPTERLVMLALADHADDSGECYPSMQRLMQRTGLTDRAIQNNVKRLVDAGYLSVETGGGRRQSNLYRLHLNPERRSENPERSSPFLVVETPNEVRKTPNEVRAEPSRTIKNRQEPSKGARDAAEVRAALEEQASPAAVASFMAYRRARKGGALTVTAAKRLAKNLRVICDGGGDPDDALGMAEERGWQTVRPEWYFRETRRNNGNRNHYSPENPSGLGRSKAAEELTDFGVRYSESGAASG